MYYGAFSSVAKSLVEMCAAWRAQVEKNTTIFVSGFDKELVGQFAATIRCGGAGGWASKGWGGGLNRDAAHRAGGQRLLGLLAEHIAAALREGSL